MGLNVSGPGTVVLTGAATPIAGRPESPPAPCKWASPSGRPPPRRPACWSTISRAWEQRATPCPAEPRLPISAAAAFWPTGPWWAAPRRWRRPQRQAGPRLQHLVHHNALLFGDQPQHLDQLRLGGRERFGRPDRDPRRRNPTDNPGGANFGCDEFYYPSSGSFYTKIAPAGGGWLERLHQYAGGAAEQRLAPDYHDDERPGPSKFTWTAP